MGIWQVDSNTSGFFRDLEAGTYVATYTVEDIVYNNYKRDSGLVTNAVIIAEMKDMDDCSVDFEISTTDGTDSWIYGGLYQGGSQPHGGQVELDKEGDDFKAGDVETYSIKKGVTPWKISSAYIHKGASSGVRPAWSFTSKFILTSSKKTFKENFVSGTEVGDNITKKQEFMKNKKANFSRAVESIGNFMTGGKDQINLATDSTYNYSYNKMVSDQFKNNYDTMDYYGAPLFQVIASNSGMQRFVRYTGVSSFNIDIEGLKKYLEKSPVQNPKYTVQLLFPDNTASGGMIDNKKVIQILNIPTVTTKSQATSLTTRYER